MCLCVEGHVWSFGAKHIFQEQITSVSTLFYTYNKLLDSQHQYRYFLIKIWFCLHFLFNFMHFILISVKFCLYVKMEFRDSINKLVLPAKN